MPKNVVEKFQIHIYVLHAFNGSDHFRNSYTNLMISPETQRIEATHIQGGTKNGNFWKTQQKLKKSKKKNLLTEIEPLKLAF